MILELNGKDATTAFSRVGHSQYAKNLMNQMKIGSVEKSEAFLQENLRNSSTHLRPELIPALQLRPSNAFQPKNTAYDFSTGNLHGGVGTQRTSSGRPESTFGPGRSGNTDSAVGQRFNPCPPVPIEASLPPVGTFSWSTGSDPLVYSNRMPGPINAALKFGDPMDAMLPDLVDLTPHGGGHPSYTNPGPRHAHMNSASQHRHSNV